MFLLSEKFHHTDRAAPRAITHSADPYHQQKVAAAKVVAGRGGGEMLFYTKEEREENEVEERDRE